MIDRFVQEIKNTLDDIGDILKDYGGLPDRISMGKLLAELGGLEEALQRTHNMVAGIEYRAALYLQAERTA